MKIRRKKKKRNLRSLRLLLMINNPRIRVRIKMLKSLLKFNKEEEETCLEC